jgi:hypothetical protein
MSFIEVPSELSGSLTSVVLHGEWDVDSHEVSAQSLLLDSDGEGNGAVQRPREKSMFES